MIVMTDNVAPIRPGVDFLTDVEREIIDAVKEKMVEMREQGVHITNLVYVLGGRTDENMAPASMIGWFDDEASNTGALISFAACQLIREASS